ncbi:MAG TPA: hypothetical protein VIY47_11450 [Ignavibacteriaceae bacterium]
MLSFSAMKSREWKTIDSISSDSIPSFLKGNFIDDYGINYSISDSLWTQHPSTRYHILKWNTKEKFLIAVNDSKNKSEPGLYTRIDYTYFENMEPYKWGFCLSVYNAKTDSLAEITYQADKQNPRKGCNGFPFSRMKKTE